MKFFCIVLILLGSAFLILDCGTSRASEKMESTDPIQKITFNILENKDNETVSAVIYIISERTQSNSELSRNDFITVNGKKPKPEYYDNGIASGSKYTITLSRASSYELLIKRGDQITKRSIISKNLNLKREFPKILSRSKSLIIPFEEKDDADIFIEIISLSGEPILRDGKNIRSKILKSEIKEGQLVVGAAQFENVKNIKAELSIAKIYRQADGTFTVKKNVIIDLID